MGDEAGAGVAVINEDLAAFFENNDECLEQSVSQELLLFHGIGGRTSSNKSVSKDYTRAEGSHGSHPFPVTTNPLVISSKPIYLFSQFLYKLKRL